MSARYDFAASLSGPGARDIQKDPVQSNVMEDASKQGGFIADIVCPVKAVNKDYVRHGRRDNQTALSLLEETLMKPGGMPNLIGRPITDWLTSIILERALRAEVPWADMDNSPSPEEPVTSASRKIVNGLRAAIEILVYNLFDPTTWDAQHTTAAGSPWAGDNTNIEEEIGLADAQMVLNGGVPSNTIIIPYNKWPRVWSCKEVRQARAFGFDSGALERNGGLPTTFFGKRLIVPGARQDTAPTGTFTPGFIWNDSIARLFYTSSPNGEPLIDDAPNFGKQFQNEQDGAAFEAYQQDDPLQMRKVRHVWGSVRRSVPEISPSASGITGSPHGYAITAI